MAGTRGSCRLSPVSAGPLLPLGNPLFHPQPISNSFLFFCILPKINSFPLAHKHPGDLSSLAETATVTGCDLPASLFHFRFLFSLSIKGPPQSTFLFNLSLHLGKKSCLASCPCPASIRSPFVLVFLERHVCSGLHIRASPHLSLHRPTPHTLSGKSR